MIKWLKNLLNKTVEKAREPIEQVWSWHCYDCPENGTGTEEEVRQKSTVHLLNTGHTVGGGLE
jgi:hypothetical protein